LDAESLRLVERHHPDFVRAGAALGEDEQARLKELNAELAVASTCFGLNLRADTNEAAVLVSDAAELAGLSEDAVAAAAAAAAARGGAELSPHPHPADAPAGAGASAQPVTSAPPV
jgi:peptidyl-dipeptidase Dcp